jgi:hypothetical protein
MIDVKEVLRRWSAGQGDRRIGREAGTDRKTVARYTDAAKKLGLERGHELTDAEVHQHADAVVGARFSLLLTIERGVDEAVSATERRCRRRLPRRVLCGARNGADRRRDRHRARVQKSFSSIHVGLQRLGQGITEARQGGRRASALTHNPSRKSVARGGGLRIAAAYVLRRGFGVFARSGNRSGCAMLSM